MILKCIGGPMDGAVYALSRETADVKQRSTTRKPDGLWFDGQDEHGRAVQHQYKQSRGCESVDDIEVAIPFDYDGPVVETGIEFETQPDGEHVQ